MTWRSTVRGSSRSASSSGAQAPGQITSRAGGVRAGRGGDAHAAVRRRRPLLHRLPEAQLGPAPGRQLQMRRHGALRPDEPGGLLVQAHLVVGRVERREATPDLRGVEHLVRQVPLAGRTQAAGHGRAVRPAEVEAAVERHQVGVQLVPQLVGAQQQRHVRRVLEVGLPDDARPAVTGPLVVRRTEAFEAEHPLTAGREMRRRGAAHAAEPEHDDVVGHAAPPPARRRMMPRA